MKEEYADVTFVVGKEEREFEINRIFLAMVSPVFKAMLFGKMKESEPNSEVFIKHIEPKIFECIINFAYCNNPHVTTSNVLPLIRACDEYQISALSDLCREFFRKCLNDNPSCFCTYISQAIELKLTECTTECIDFLKQAKKSQIEEVIHSAGFREMDLKKMRLILELDMSNCEEETLWDAVLEWADYQSSRNFKSVDVEDEDAKIDNDDDEKEEPNNAKAYRIYLLKSVRDLIRFGLMDGVYFSKFVEPEKVLNGNELLTVCLYFIDKDRGCGKFSVKPRGKRNERKYQSFMKKNDAVLFSDAPTTTPPPAHRRRSRFAPPNVGPYQYSDMRSSSELPTNDDIEYDTIAPRPFRPHRYPTSSHRL